MVHDLAKVRLDYIEIFFASQLSFNIGIAQNHVTKATMRDVKCSMEQYSGVRVELNFSCMRTALSYGTKHFGHGAVVI